MSELTKIGGGKNNTSKKFYKTPELHVINIESNDIICTSDGFYNSENAFYDLEEEI